MAKRSRSPKQRQIQDIERLLVQGFRAQRVSNEKKRRAILSFERRLSEIIRTLEKQRSRRAKRARS